MLTLDRRRFMAMSAFSFAGVAMPALAAAGTPMNVVRDPNCGCCGAWVDILRADGFEITVEHRLPADLVSYKVEKKIPFDMFSCHTASTGGYVIEGHVPAADIRRLLDEKPEAIGLAVPEMPYGSPGMGPEDKREAYDVFLIAKDGSTSVFTHYPAAA